MFRVESSQWIHEDAFLAQHTEFFEGLRAARRYAARLRALGYSVLITDSDYEPIYRHERLQAPTPYRTKRKYHKFNALWECPF